VNSLLTSGSVLVTLTARGPFEETEATLTADYVAAAFREL
jgi:hypothetical protein